MTKRLVVLACAILALCAAVSAQERRTEVTTADAKLVADDIDWAMKTWSGVATGNVDITFEQEGVVATLHAERVELTTQVASGTGGGGMGGRTVGTVTATGKVTYEIVSEDAANAKSYKLNGEADRLVYSAANKKLEAFNDRPEPVQIVGVMTERPTATNGLKEPVITNLEIVPRKTLTITFEDETTAAATTSAGA